MAIFNGDHDLNSQILGFFQGFSPVDYPQESLKTGNPGDPEPMNGHPIELKYVRTGTMVTCKPMKSVSIRNTMAGRCPHEFYRSCMM